MALVTKLTISIFPAPAPSVFDQNPLSKSIPLIFARLGGSAMSAARKSIKKSESLCVQKWRTRSLFIRKLAFPNHLRPEASPPHGSLQLGGLALPTTTPRLPPWEVTCRLVWIMRQE